MHLPKTAEQGKGIAYLVIGIAIVVIAFIVLNKILKGTGGVLEMLNLKDTKDEAANKQFVSDQVRKEQAKGNGSAWSPLFWNTGGQGTKLFPVATAQTLAVGLYDSVGYIYDSPSKGAAAIKSCTTKSQVSFVSDQFNKKYSIDLLPWLANKYDTAEQKQYLVDMITYVDNLPKYK